MVQQLLLATVVAATLVLVASADGTASEQQVSVADDECPSANADECSLNALKATTLQPEDDDAQALKVDEGDEEGGGDQPEDDGAPTPEVDGGEAEGGRDQPEDDDTPSLKVDGGDVEGGGYQLDDDASALKMDGGDAEGGGEQLEDDDTPALKVDGGDAEGGGVPKANSVSKEDKEEKPGAFDFVMANYSHMTKLILYWCKVAVVTVFNIPLFVFRDVGTPINTIVMVWGASLTSMAVWWVVIKRSASSGGGSVKVFVEEHQFAELKTQLAVMQEKLNTLQTNQNSMQQDKIVAQVSKELTEEEIYVISKNIRQELRIYVHSLFNSIKPSKKYCEQWGIDHKLPEKLVQLANELDGRSFPVDRNLYPKPEHLGGPKNTNPNAALPAWKKEAAEWHRTHQPRPRHADATTGSESCPLPTQATPTSMAFQETNERPLAVLSHTRADATTESESCPSATQATPASVARQDTNERPLAVLSHTRADATTESESCPLATHVTPTSVACQETNERPLAVLSNTRTRQRVPFNPGPPPPTNPFAAAAAMQQKNDVPLNPGPPPPTNPFAAAAAMKQNNAAAEVPRDLFGLATGTPARPELDI